MDVLNNNSMEFVSKQTNNIEIENINLNGATGIKEEDNKMAEPFSALTTSMWPQNPELGLSDEEFAEDVDYRFDEFGFRVIEGKTQRLRDNEHQDECDRHRLEWLAHLEFTYSRSLEGELSWEDIEPAIHPDGQLKRMIREKGVPHSLRPQLWMRMSGALNKRSRCSTAYRDIVATTGNDHQMCAKQIEKDLVRTLPSNACFSTTSSTGIPRLRRILRGLAWLYPDIGYCQGMGVIVAHLLLILEEEDTFWLMCVILEELLPVSYYSSNLIGVQADQRVLRYLLPRHLPDLDELLTEHDIEISLITLHWFLTVFASVVNIRQLLRLWDIFFYEGSSFMFKIIIGMLKLRTPELLSYDNTAQIFNCLSKLPSEIEDINLLIKTSYELAGDLDRVEINALHKRFLGEIMSSDGLLVDPNHNLPKQRINKRQLSRSRSMISQLLWHNSNSSLATSGAGDPDCVKIKNVRQTEMLVDLRNAILQLVRHFELNNSSTDVKFSSQPDYSLQSHAEDLERYVQVVREPHRRAKAVLDFERHDEDELGFRKNDVIRLVSSKDEHCWVGELNGVRGWFPAKFVEVLDERSKDYCAAGDDSVNEEVADLVRGVLCPTIKSILEHGMKKAHLLDSKCHPWLFIEEAASHEVEKDFHSVYSRLMLCKTFRLDEDGKVLTPEELLYKAIQSVNYSHDNAHAQMDVKLRSLICCGLNEQVLHLWLETLCSSADVIKKWYHPWSFIRSPGWVQIKCELRLLCQFSFTLSAELELAATRLRLLQSSSYSSARGTRSRRQSASSSSCSTSACVLAAAAKTSDNVQRNVRDMLVKHHLFSWEIN